MIWDCHAHQIGKQDGGFIIALENQKEAAVINNNLLQKVNMGKTFIPVEYVTNSFQETNTDIVKYHPRLEKYTYKEVVKDISHRKVKGIIFDTLNEPYWKSDDYWKIANKFPQIQFLFSHAGGYKILEFIEICEFCKNVWIDFSFTQNHFGLIGNNSELKAVTDIIKYSFSANVKRKILFGSDYPYVNQEECIEYYVKNVPKEIYSENYINFLYNIGM